MERGIGIRRLAIGFVAVAALVAAQGAGAGTGVTCGPPEAIFDVTEDGTSLRVAAAYRTSAGPFHQIGFRSKGTNANGDPAGGAGTCGDADRWERLTILLGDSADKARLDNRKPRFLADFGPVPKFVDVGIDGGSGPDALRGHRGENTLLGGRGRDVIKAAGPGKVDSVDCGPGGGDKAVVDQEDNVSRCETVVID